MNICGVCRSMVNIYKKIELLLNPLIYNNHNNKSKSKMSTTIKINENDIKIMSNSSYTIITATIDIICAGLVSLIILIFMIASLIIEDEDVKYMIVVSIVIATIATISIINSIVAINSAICLISDIIKNIRINAITKN